jgi:hypothetical protein
VRYTGKPMEGIQNFTCWIKSIHAH